MYRWGLSVLCLVVATSAVSLAADWESAATPGAAATSNKRIGSQVLGQAATKPFGRQTQAQSSLTGKVRYIKVFGTVHAPVIVMSRRKMMESKAPGVRLELTTLSSTPDINQAILTNNADAGSLGAAPVLIGWSKGIPYRIGASLGSVPLKLITTRDEIKTLKDLKQYLATSGAKIAVIGLGTLQHQFVQMAAEKEFGDPKALDPYMVAMPQPDSRAALKAKRDIAARVSSPPALTVELKEQGVRELADAFEVAGVMFPLATVVVSRRFHDEQPEVYRLFIETLKEAMDWIAANPDETAKILSEEAGGKIPPAVFLQDLRTTKFDITPRGIMRFSDFMLKTGQISKKPSSWRDLTWPNLHGLNGN
ncbi:MAG: ABC transporter substrate-binding protein [Betaproteobacteria bacterium]|nr:ABC transporter substrate-binding protein [Betaproteobacteria bacterium]